MRHFLDDGVDPFEIRRRVGRVKVQGLRVLDLTNPGILAALELSVADLVGDDYTISQRLAASTLLVGFDGILAPSAALEGRRTLVVFASAPNSAIVEKSSTVRQPRRV
jgi:hypothetical protein